MTTRSAFGTAVPAGITVVSETSELCVTYRSAGMGCFVVFIVVGVLGLGIGVALAVFNRPDEIVRIVTSSWGAAVCSLAGVVAWFFWTGLLVWFLFGETEVVASAEKLHVTWRLFGLSCRRVVPRENIRGFVQIQDGGRGDDSFPSWGLKAVAGHRNVSLLYRQPFGVSDWLGSRLAGYYGVDFTRADSRD